MQRQRLCRRFTGTHRLQHQMHVIIVRRAKITDPAPQTATPTMTNMEDRAGPTREQLRRLFHLTIELAEWMTERRIGVPIQQRCGDRFG